MDRFARADTAGQDWSAVMLLSKRDFCFQNGGRQEVQAFYEVSSANYSAVVELIYDCSIIVECSYEQGFFSQYSIVYDDDFKSQRLFSCRFVLCNPWF